MAFTGGAHKFDIGSAEFQNAQTIINHGTGQSAIYSAANTLREARAVEATHASRTASYAPRCHAGTRAKIIEDIMTWVEKHELPFLWFSGPAGSGKTTVVRDVVDLCGKSKSPGLITASYFFSTRVPGCSDESPFVATIAHQLIETVPALKRAILKAISDHPTIFDNSLDSQLETLIINPLRSLSSPPQQLVIAIDGFDECIKEKERKHLLRLLLSLVESNLPASILIVLTSRPEFDIRTAFENAPFRNITRALRLQDYDGTSDVHKFYCDEFQRIRRTHPMRASIPGSWPVEMILNTLTDKSSGNFILPWTTIRYIDDPHQNPMELLEKAMAIESPSPTEEHPLAPLDALYAHILHHPGAKLPIIKRLFHSIIAMNAVHADTSHLSSYFLDLFLELPPGTVETTLCDLHSVISIPSPDSGPKGYIHFHHKSLEDYLVSQHRSKDLYQPPYDTQIDFTLVCVKHLCRWAQNPCADIDGPTRYASLLFNEHLSWSLENKPNSVRLPDPILEFDPRIIWKYRFVAGNYFPYVDIIRAALHSSMCPRQSCLPLCRLLSHMEFCEEGVNTYSERVRRDQSNRLETLPLFEVESGLYAGSSLDIPIPAIPPPTAPTSTLFTPRAVPQTRSRGIKAVLQWLSLFMRRTGS